MFMEYGLIYQNQMVKKMYDEIKKNISSVDILINNAIINKGSRFY